MRNRVGGPGSYNAICDVCGLKYKASALLKRWDGLMVCKWDWEPRHPQEFIRAKNDNVPLPFIRPDSDGIDVGPTYDCSVYEVEQYVNHVFLGILQDKTDGTGTQEEYTIHKVKTYGGTLHIPDGLILHVTCSLEIGT